jgi:hypothetical protein
MIDGQILVTIHRYNAIIYYSTIKISFPPTYQHSPIILVKYLNRLEALSR